MKILIINSRYFLSAGPEKYMFGLKEILENKGHIVVPFSVKNSNNNPTEYESYFVDPIGGEDKVYFDEYKKDPKTIYQLLERQFYSFDVYKALDKLIKETKPDIAYILHHCNKLSPSIINACKNNKIPVVMRLSDFFMVCPEGTMYRNGVCDLCVNGSLFPAIKYRCVKKSLPSSIIKVAAMYFHRMIGIYNKVDYVICPSKFTLNIVKPQLKKVKFKYLPTFVKIRTEYNPYLGNYALIVGRIEPNKGIMTAIKAVEGSNHKLIIVGKSSTRYDEELKKYIAQHNLKNVELLGPKYGKELDKIYDRSRCVIIPAQWYENMPNVALEAMQHSKPIIASDLGSLKEIVRNNYNGLLFDYVKLEELRKSIDLIFKSDRRTKQLGKNSYNQAIKEYDPEKHYNRLIRVFKDVVKRHHEN